MRHSSARSSKTNTGQAKLHQVGFAGYANGTVTKENPSEVAPQTRENMLPIFHNDCYVAELYLRINWSKTVGFLQRGRMNREPIHTPQILHVNWSASTVLHSRTLNERAPPRTAGTMKQ